MALVVQDDTGTVAGANSYLSVAAFRAFHSARGVSTSAHPDGSVESALIRATIDYLDLRFKFVGRIVSDDQTTAWPRRYRREATGRYFEEIPQAVKDACAEYALRALSGDLLPDAPMDASGLRLRSHEYEIGGQIRQKRDFVETSQGELPDFPRPDLRLRRARLIRTGADVIRA